MAEGCSAIERDTFTQTLKMLKHSIYPVFTVIESRAYKSAQRTGAAPAAALPVEAIFNRRPGGPAALVAPCQRLAPSGAGHEKVIWSR